ncbi:hypothetical protein Tco_1015894 [Tanacetum coccineum]|uniref:No apical meristem-associated C-terminal domain-containing protein n=1 Tax=Tanacetum coccineum TaxID=301880 RepID=A0ABQ5FN64_9ASTR
MENKKKPSRNRQKMMIQSDDAPRQTPWTTEEEIALAKGWLSVSKNNKYGNTKKNRAFESGGEDEDYVQRAMIHDEIETGIPFKLHHRWEILKDRSKWQEIEIRRPKGRDKARAAGRKNKGSKPARSSTLNEDEMARLMVTEMTAQEKEERLAFLDIKRREVECREPELEQQDMRFYLQPYDHLTGDQRKAMDEIRAKTKAKYNLQY